MPTQYGCLLEQGRLLVKPIRRGVLIRDGVLIRRRALIESLWYLTFQLGRSTPTFCGLLSPTGYKCVVNFCHAKTWERRSRSYQLSGASHGSRSHTVIPLKACLHESGELQVGKVTCVAMLKKKPASSSSK